MPLPPNIIARCPCSREWASYIECHCAAVGCHRQFVNVDAFDAHRINGECADPVTRVSRRTGNPLLQEMDRGHGPIWRKWVSPEKAEKYRQHIARKEEKAS